MTHQEVYNRIRDHLLTQKSKALGDPVLGAPQGACCYRAPDGKRCAVGCLIADEHYSADFENKRIETYDAVGLRHAVAESLGLDRLDPEMVTLLKKMQRIHDMRTVSDWPEEIAAVARELGLQP